MGYKEAKGETSRRIVVRKREILIPSAKVAGAGNIFEK